MALSMNDLVARARNATGEVSPQEAQAHLDDGGLILDVREAEELTEDGRIDGALHVPRGVLESRADPQSSAADNRLAGYRGNGREVHVLCASGARAAMAAERLTEMGYRAKPIAGGIKAWREAGLDVDTK